MELMTLYPLEAKYKHNWSTPQLHGLRILPAGNLRCKPCASRRPAVTLTVTDEIADGTRLLRGQDGQRDYRIRESDYQALRSEATPCL